MKSKSFDLKRIASDKSKPNKTFDFTSYYKTAAETKKAVETSKGTIENINKENKFAKTKNGSPSKSERTPNKKKIKNGLDPLDLSHIDIEDPNSGLLGARSAPLNESKLTSTPHASINCELKVKSIMKNKSGSNSDDTLNTSSYNVSSKSKKRNKSVSFMLDDTEEVVVKKTKSNESIEKKQQSSKKQTFKESTKEKKLKNVKRDIIGKENKKNGNVNPETSSLSKGKKTEDKSILKNDKLDVDNETPNNNVPNQDDKNVNKKRKFKKVKKQNSEETMEAGGENNDEAPAENKTRKAKKKKQFTKSHNSETMEAEGEPAAKAQKKDDKPEAIVEKIESLSIGDNAHTLTNLLDEMTVVDKNKKKKIRKKVKKVNKATTSTSSSESADLEKIEEGKEKIKWKKRKWNKDKKGDVTEEDATATSVIVDNLPLSMVCDYKKVLADHFGKHGLIKKIGVAEVYPEEESKPVFTTTIQFYSDGAAAEAASSGSVSLGAAEVVVRRALAPAQTTLVVRSYGALSDQSVSSAFAAAGRIRAIRHLVKGRKAIATAFVEFDGPDALSRAVSLGARARIAGKRVHAAPWAPRRPRPAPAPAPAPATSDRSEDSDQ